MGFTYGEDLKFIHGELEICGAKGSFKISVDFKILCRAYGRRLKFCFKNGSRRFGELGDFKFNAPRYAVAPSYIARPKIIVCERGEILKFNPILELNFISQRAAKLVNQ